MKLKTKDLVYVALFVVLMAVCSWISVPTPVPFTLQTLGLFLAVGFLGGKKTTFTVTVYLLLGIIGVPIFASFTAGPGILLGINGGFLMGFLLSAIVVWIMESLGVKSSVVKMLCSLFICYACGVAWYVFYVNVSAGLWSALTLLVLPYILPDAIKILLALALCKRLKSLRLGE